jgi:NADPH:quinone reductase-like Zn-dependent oxidoreductase
VDKLAKKIASGSSRLSFLLPEFFNFAGSSMRAFVLDREFAFAQLPAALTYLEAGRARGKVVLRVK